MTVTVRTKGETITVRVRKSGDAVPVEGKSGSMSR